MRKILIALFFAFFLAGCTPEKNTGNERPEIFIISLEKYRDFEGRDMWLFNYAMNGEVHQAVFSNTVRAQDYLEYLQTVGNIIGREQ